MRILHTEWSDGLGGQEKRILAERGHSVHIACRARASIKIEAERLGIDTVTVPMRRLYDIQSVLRLTGFLNKNRFDVVNTHSGVDSWIGGIASRVSKVPVLARTRHLNIPLKRNLLNFVHYLPDVYITCGNNMRSNLVSNCGFPADKVVSIPTGVGPEFFDVKKNVEAKLKYGLLPDSIVITNVGVLRSVKGHEITLRSAKAVLKVIPNAKYLIVGNGPRKEALMKFTNELGIAEHVVFTGFAENIPEIYSFSDIAVLSSLSEGLPQSLLQAMAAGIPVVATRVGGVPEVVIHEKTGLLVESGDHEGLAKGIIRILRNPDDAGKMSRDARELILKEHTIDKMIDKIEGLYKKLLLQKAVT